MRNTTMRDKLAGALEQTDLSTDLSTELTAPPAKKKATKKTSDLTVLAPRYVAPPQRANPFAVHTFASGLPQRQDPMMEELPPLEVVREPEQSMIAVEEPPEKTSQEEPPPEEQTPPEIPYPPESKPEAEIQPPPVEDTPATIELPALPTNLAWLDKPTPFSGNLSAIIESLRSARTLCACTLEEARARRKQKQDALDSEDFLILQQQEYLKSIENTMSACALVAEQSIGIEPRLLAPKSLHEKKPAKVNAQGKRTIHMPDKDDPNILRIEEVKRFFDQNPNVNWTAAEIIAELPSHKRAHAKVYLSAAMSTLASNDAIERVGRGIYRKTVA